MTNGYRHSAADLWAHFMSSRPEDLTERGNNTEHDQHPPNNGEGSQQFTRFLQPPLSVRSNRKRSAQEHTLNRHTDDATTGSCESSIGDSITRETERYSLDTLPMEILIAVLSFLTVTEARIMMEVNTIFHGFLCGVNDSEAIALWKDYAEREWPVLQETNNNGANSVSFTHSPSKLLAIACPLPTKMKINPHIQPLLQAVKVDHLTYYHYKGVTGQGDRCIRADIPLPGPNLASCRRQVSKPFLNRLRRGDPAISLPFLPICTPRFGPDGNAVLAPRIVSYFEVSIGPLVQDQTLQQEQVSFHHPSHHQRFVRSNTECIAVGLATRHFSWRYRMPGWDRNSIGYHSDDGGLFFGSGSMQRKYGPKFGAGDVIGCGIDHFLRNVFFTHNGQYLGDAIHLGPPLSNTYLQCNEWFPVIGLDSNALVHCNFAGPYKYDLDSFIEEKGYNKLVHEAMAPVESTPVSSLREETVVAL